ncbi:hypothetical protein OIU77_002500 [Salix suchowensis]|uniref:Uncharacterized protein n=1 Tax=Salix suchowensis TaxID=1278906 RepID=A0ABQ9AYK1_9ROSI|nr:hypothetical protein OIU77_002500 [Salix suchowensis]
MQWHSWREIWSLTDGESWERAEQLGSQTIGGGGVTGFTVSDDFRWRVGREGQLPVSLMMIVNERKKLKVWGLWVGDGLVLMEKIRVLFWCSNLLWMNAEVRRR